MKSIIIFLYFFKDGWRSENTAREAAGSVVYIMLFSFTSSIRRRR